LTIAVDVEPSCNALAGTAFQMAQKGHSQREG
jgi:hypothetical protein